ncbi:hypothetical protein JCM11251_003659 [Rhodosporidiobolus azoricus]
MSSSSTAQRDYFPQHIAASAALTHLSLVLFPSTYSDPFLASCLQHWLAQPAPGGSARWTTEQLVERTCEKLLSEEARETSEAGKVVAWVADGFERGEVERGEIGQEEEVKTRWARGKGKGKGKADAPSPSRKGSGGGGKVEDVALARNLALIRLHALFPLVPIVEIRVLLLSLEHTFLYQATEELLLRTGSSLSVRGRGGAAGNEVVDLAEVGRSVLAGLRSLFKRADAAAAEHKGKGKVSTVPAPHDPVFTPQDLFRSPSYTRILLSHFSTLFPSLPHALVRRAVEEEGGSYAAIRAKLEIEAAGKAARSASGRGIGKGKWWNAFGGLFAPPPLSSGVGGSGNREGPADDVQREKDARRIVRESRNRAAEREVEAYYASIERPRMRPRRVHGSERRLEGWVSEVPSPPAPEADEDDPLLSLTSARTVECQCCFADIHLSCSSPTAFSCDASPSSSAHSFCTDCLLTYTRTFITGGTPLPSVSLITIALPCFAAGSPGSPPCRGVLRSSTLRTALDRRTIKQFEARIAAANLEALVAGGSGGEGGLSAAPPKIHRCPFCPYAELAPAPSWGGPLSRAFVPAWGVLWPPDIASVVASALGAVALVVFATLVGVLVLLWPLPLPRLEKIYSDLYPSSTPAPPHPPAAAEADNHRDLPPAPVLPLPLNASLVLSPHHLPPLSLAYLRGITERVIRRKEGKRTVFRCRNLGERKKLGESGREGEEWLSSLEGAEGRMREWLGGDLEEEEGEIEVEAGEAGEGEVEERRRRKLVEIVWGKEAVEALDGQLSATQQGPEEEEEEKCGRLSCLLCSSALNPSAPSLHRCQSPSSLSTSSSSAPGSEAAERERAEESLRLAVERAMSEAVQRRCERCGAGVVKEGGCNKITCRCGAAYCWSCRSPISPSVGYRHFCQHFLPDRSFVLTSRLPLRVFMGAGVDDSFMYWYAAIQGCTECSRCSLWKEGDEKGRIREAAAAARRQWALDHPDWARKVDLQGVVVGPPAGLAEGHPLSAVILDSFERTVEYVVGILLCLAPLTTTRT